MTQLYKLCPAIGFFTSANHETRLAEANVALRESVSLSLGWHFAIPQTEVCVTCRRIEGRRVFPGIVGREKGTLRDFADPRPYQLIASEEVARELQREFRGFEAKHVIIYGSTDFREVDVRERYPELTVDERKDYKGRTPVELWLPLKVRIAETPSTYTREYVCDNCGRFYPQLTGTAALPREVEVAGEYVMREYQPRLPGNGLLVPKELLGSHDAFETDSGLQVVTSKVRSFIESKGWRNIRFLEVGEVV